MQGGAVNKRISVLTWIFLVECGQDLMTLIVSWVTYVDLCDYLSPSPSLDPFLDPLIASSLCLYLYPSFSHRVTTIWNGNDACSLDIPDVENGNGTLTSLVCSVETLISCCSCSMGIWNGTSSCSDLGILNDVAFYHVIYKKFNSLKL